MLKRVDTAAYAIIKDSYENKLNLGNSVELTTKEDGVGYTLENSNIKINEEDIKQIEEIKNKIKGGDIVVPNKVEEIDAFIEGIK